MLKTLPAELWIRILSIIANDPRNFPTLWVHGRAVSTLFKEAIETSFRERQLPKTFITYELGIFDFDDNDGTSYKLHLSPEFKFSHLSTDKHTAFFRELEIHEDYKPLTISSLRSVLEMNHFEKPPHTVQVRCDLNDTPIPQFEIDCETMTIGCDWRGLFSVFFGEELLFKNMGNRAMESIRPRVSALVVDLDAERTAVADVMQQVLQRYGGESDKARKQARRMRIRKQYEQNGYKDWKPRKEREEEEDSIIKNLKGRRFYTWRQEFSDEGSG